MLAIIGAVGIGALYDARQQYEDQLSAASSLEVASANLLAATVALEANLTRPRSRTAAGFVACAETFVVVSLTDAVLEGCVDIFAAAEAQLAVVL